MDRWEKKHGGELWRLSWVTMCGPLIPTADKKQLMFSLSAPLYFVWNPLVLSTYFKTFWKFVLDSMQYHFCISLINLCATSKKAKEKEITCWNNQESKRNGQAAHNWGHLSCASSRHPAFQVGQVSDLTTGLLSWALPCFMLLLIFFFPVKMKEMKFKSLGDGWDKTHYIYSFPACSTEERKVHKRKKKVPREFHYG